MDKNFNLAVAKMRSLMERVEKPHTNYQATINEERLINEAMGAKKAVTRDEIVDILEDQDEKGNGGLYATLVYATAAPIYTTKRAGYWRADDVNNMLDATRAEHGESAWHKDLSAYNDPSVKNSTKNPIAVVCVTSYNIHWTTKSNYDKAYEKYADALHNLRMSHGIGIESDGMLGDNPNQRQNIGAGTQMNQNGELSKDFNMANVQGEPDVKYYRVDVSGHVDYNSEIPEEAIKAMSKLYKPAGPEKGVADVISGEELEAYMEAKRELDAKFKGRTLNFHAMLAISANVNGISYYYINDELQLSDKKAIPVNMQDMVKIAEKTIKQTYVPMTGFANGQSMIGNQGL